MYKQRFLIVILSAILRIESTALLQEDYTPQSHCDFRRTGCISAPDNAIQEAANLIRFKEMMLTCMDAPHKHVPTFEVTQFTELANINKWPDELLYCQCNLGACAANAIAFCIRYLSIRNSKNPTNFLTNPERLDPSRLYIYYNTRFLEGAMWGTNSTLTDSGATMPGTILALDKYGCCPEYFRDNPEKPSNIIDYRGFVYDTRNFTSQPSPESYRFAYDPSFCGLNTCKELEGNGPKNPYHYVSKYVQYTDLLSKYEKLRYLSAEQKEEIVRDFKTILRRNIPIFYGFSLDKSYDNHCNGFIQMPNISKFVATSGHAVTIVGYGNYNKNDPSKNYFKFINSWGPSWGHRGYGYLPEEYITNPNIFSRGCYAIDLPRVTITITITKEPSGCLLKDARPEPSPIVKEMEEILSQKADGKSKDDAAEKDIV